MNPVLHRTLVDEVEVFWREAGSPSAPTVVLLPGHPSGSHAYRDLSDRLATRWHVIAPDYPGYGFSATPAGPWTFDRLAELTIGLLDTIGVEQFALYMFDFGAPVGFRVAEAHPTRITGLISQNGNIYPEGFGPGVAALAEWWSDRTAHQSTVDEFLSAAGTRMQWQAGARNPDAIDPALWTLDQALLGQPGHRHAAEALLWDYQHNPARFDGFHHYLREHQPPLLAVWGANDPFFLPAGAEAFTRDVPDAEVVLLDTGHFALVEELDQVVHLVDAFLARATSRSRSTAPANSRLT
ncbi:MAG: alpha/beta fold hydrolase [Ilumatobacteraceae bacterium]